MIELPFELGQTAYFIINGEIVEDTITFIRITYDIASDEPYDCPRIDVHRAGSTVLYYESEVFTTREEAERKMEEWKRK